MFLFGLQPNQKLKKNGNTRTSIAWVNKEVRRLSLTDKVQAVNSQLFQRSNNLPKRNVQKWKSLKNNFLKQERRSKFSRLVWNDSRKTQMMFTQSTLGFQILNFYFTYSI